MLGDCMEVQLEHQTFQLQILVCSPDSYPVYKIHWQFAIELGVPHFHTDCELNRDKNPLKVREFSLWNPLFGIFENKKKTKLHARMLCVQWHGHFKVDIHKLSFPQASDGWGLLQTLARDNQNNHWGTMKKRTAGLPVFLDVWSSNFYYRMNIRTSSNS